MARCLLLGLAVAASLPARAQEPPAGEASAPRVQGRSWVQVPRSTGRLQARDLGLVINAADPYSVQVGAHYAAARGLAPEQILRLSLPLRPALTAEEFATLQQAIAAHFGAATQALALAWVMPYAVDCNSITGALAIGFDAGLCARSCGASRPSPYFNSPSARPWTELGLRPSMLLAAPSVGQAKALIDRGVAADASLAQRGRPPVNVALLVTPDVPRRVRMFLYPPPGALRGVGVNVRVEPEAALASMPRVLMVQTGSVHAPVAVPPDWVAGGLGDHLTSYGGSLGGQAGQGTVLDWIGSGATASHGTVSEPCNHVQKFPHPQVLLLHYLQGATALEAYWKSVAWPQQSLFVGEPLAAPFAPR